MIKSDQLASGQLAIPLIITQSLGWSSQTADPKKSSYLRCLTLVQ